MRDALRGLDGVCRASGLVPGHVLGNGRVPGHVRRGRDRSRLCYQHSSGGLLKYVQYGREDRRGLEFLLTGA